MFETMFHVLRRFLSRPLAEDFRFRPQGWSSVQGGLYVFLFLYLFSGARFPPGLSRVGMLALFGLGVTGTTLLANYGIPRLFPRWYDDERWTVGRHILHVLLVLLLISAGNQLILRLFDLEAPPFWRMYLLVTLIGFFPITINVFVTEQRRLKRHLAQAEAANRTLDKLHQPDRPTEPAELPKGLLLTSENGRERLSLLPNQLLYVESVGNYVEVHWLNLLFPQKTVLRNTLKNVEAALADQPQFFRCHRAFLVNLRAVSQTTGNARGYQLTISGSQREIPVARGYLDAFDARMAELA